MSKNQSNKSYWKPKRSNLFQILETVALQWKVPRRGKQIGEQKVEKIEVSQEISNLGVIELPI